MAITFVSGASLGLSAASTTYTVSAPAGIADDDLLVLVIAHGRSVVGPAPGWETAGGHQDGSNIGTSIFYRRAKAADTTWTFYQSSHIGAWWCGAYRGGGWVQGAAVLVRTSLVTTQPIVNSYSPQAGLRLDLLATWRNSATGCVHADPAWGLRRAYVDSNSGTSHIELTVVERTAVAMTYYSDNFTMTNTPGANPLSSLLHLVEAPVPAEMVYQEALAGVVVAPFSGWVYKGRARNTDDTPEVP